MSKRGASGKGSAPAPGVAASALSAADTERCWRDLSSLLSVRDSDEVKHAQVQSLADRLFQSSVLSGAPDGDALEVLSVSLLQQSRWSQLVPLLAAHPQLVAANAQLSFHLAYALYRDKQHTRALEELRRRGASGLSDGELHLQAQALYRAGQYAAAAKVYRDTHLAEDHDVELEANLLAALVSAGQLDEARAYMSKLKALTEPESYELAYNAACGLIECGDYRAALAALRKAQDLCREVLAADGVSDADIDHELGGLRVQEAFILQQLSRVPGAADGTENERALALYTRVLAEKKCDPNVASIASNNVITLRQGASKIWDSLKKSNKAMELDLKDFTLSARQKSAIQLNRALVLFHGKQYDKCRDLLATLTKEFPTNVQMALAQAAVLARDKARLKDAEEVLRDWLRANDATAAADAVQSVYLGLAHLALMRGDVSGAINALTTLASKSKSAGLQHTPALVATLVALYERNNDLEGAHAAIQAAIQHWSASSKKDPAAARLLQQVLSSAGAFYNRHGRESDAAQLLELLAAETQSGSSATSRAESVARLVLAYSSDPAKQSAYIAQLPALPVPAALDVKQLESVPAPEVAKRRKADKSAASASAKKADDTDGGDSDGEDGEGDDKGALSASLAKAAARKAAKEKSKAKAKKKPPTRYPKGFDPANPGPMPDPERWLPRWERSNQKKFNKRRAGNAIRGAQGSTNMANMPAKELDASTGGVEAKGQMSAAAAAAARKRAGKKARPTDK